MGYWQERQEAMYKAGEMQVNKYFTRLEKAFNQTRRELQKTIDAFYFRYAEENGLSFAAAQKKLDAEELGELQDFIDLVMKNIGKYNQQVNNMSIKARITRYQALEAQVDAILRQLYTIDYESEAERTMQEVYGDTYYRTWYNADQYHGFHAEFAQVNPTVVEKLLEYPFNGAAFSDRLWKQKDHLQAQLMEAVTTMLIQGRHPSSLTKEFAKKMNSKKFDAYRLLHTESSFLMSEATHAGYKEDGVPKYEILATLDSKTCNVCGDLDNKVYEVGKEVTGVNMPPFHPLCRCTTVPHYDDTPTEGLTRVARDSETGKNYEVPADMSWKEWKKEYVDKQEENQKRKQQAYRPVSRGESTFVEIKPNQKISIQKVDGYSDKVYISDNASIKPRALHTINLHTQRALEQWGIPLERKPKIVIVSPDELPTAYGKYDAITNTVYYIPQIVDKKVVEKLGDVEYHEMWHMRQAENFRKKHGEIIRENYGKYIEYSCQKAKNVIDQAGIDRYNVGEISDYAKQMYNRQRYDEVEAEYMVANRKKV
jgi:SPP1 gp7 family putative phage head morphogenesis protein